MDRKRTLERERYKTSAFKKRKVQLKKTTVQEQDSKEVREGKTYDTSIDIEQPQDRQDIESIPPFQSPPVKTPLTGKDYTWVFFDLETTGLGLTAEILEIGAVRGSDTFQRFVKPLGSISMKATSVHGMFMKDGNLMKKGQVLSTTDLRHALLDFATWLSSTSNNVLLGHNGLNFDFPLLVKYLLSVNISTNVVGYVDTLHVFKSLLPTHTGSFSQECLLRESEVQFEGHSHCALDDCKILQKLVHFHNVTDVSLIQSSVSSEYIFGHFSYRVSKEKNYRSLQVLVHEHVISDFMANKIASSGLNFSHLQLAYDRSGEDGIRNLFVERVNSKVRVSKCKKIWSSVANYFSHKS